MAYKEESEQEFMESVIRQISRPGQPVSDMPNDRMVRMGFQNLDDPDPEEINPFEIRGDRPHWDTPTGHRERAMASIRAKRPGWPASQGKDSGEVAPFEPNAYLSGKQQTRGYSTDHGVHHMDGGEEESNPHMEMKELKKQIKEKERELHELQQQKVKLMRKITGRLE